jgi:hypothetical protein
MTPSPIETKRCGDTVGIVPQSRRLIEVSSEIPHVHHYRGNCHPLPVILGVSMSITRFPGLLLANLQRGAVQQPSADADWRARQAGQRQQWAICPVCGAGLDNPLGL